MAVTINSNVSASIPERWELKTLKFRYTEAVIAPRMLMASENLLNYGDIYHFPTDQELSVGAVSSNADFDTTAVNLTDNTVTVNTWRYVSFEVSKLAKRQSNIDIKDNYAPACGKALAADADGLLAATITSVAASNIVGSADNPTIFDENVAFAALLKFADTNLLGEKAQLSFIVPPIAILDGLARKDRWTAANLLGVPKSVLTNGIFLPILGVPVYQSTKLTSSGDSYNCILMHKEWQGLVMQVKLNTESASGVPAKRLTDMYVAYTIYGYGQLRNTYAVQFFVKKSATYSAA